MMTRNGIVYDLKLSPYYITIDEVTFYFSSKNHLEKFTEKLTENREVINYSLSKRFGVNINFKILNDIVLYSKVETRGFLIKHKGEAYSCKKHIVLNGVILTKKP
jgi:YHS domain-containing protein|nr:MAG TPA: hypothetical protein [Caudoviricetes sp.]